MYENSLLYGYVHTLNILNNDAITFDDRSGPAVNTLGAR